uniref:Uncharacterized protein n=1 Tax=Arundo donax TaxID=35708 RepID=A0A0A9FM38_ARUDO
MRPLLLTCCVLVYRTPSRQTSIISLSECSIVSNSSNFHRAVP